MRTVGEMLRTRRTERRMSLEDVERKIRIRVRFLRAIEADDYGKLPSRAYAEGFVRTYGKFLGFNEKNITAFFRRQLAEPSKSMLLPKKTDAVLRSSWVRLTPSRFLAILLLGFLSIFAVYFGFQYKALNDPPRLTVSVPQNDSTIDSTRVDVIGETDPDATITVQGISVLVREDGKFFDQVQLQPGTNTITVISTSRLGKTAVVERSVIHVPAS